MFRYLMGTKCGEIYMIAFELKNINLMASSNQSKFDANNFMVIEYIGSRLSECSSIVYIDNGYIHYGSMNGDSYLI